MCDTQSSTVCVCVCMLVCVTHRALLSVCVYACMCGIQSSIMCVCMLVCVAYRAVLCVCSQAPGVRTGN